SPGNNTTRFDVAISSNAPLTAAIAYKPSPINAALENVVKKARGWSNLKVFYANKLRPKITIASKTNSSSTDPDETKDPSCGCLSERMIQYYLNLYKNIGQPLTRALLCKAANESMEDEGGCSGGGSSGDGVFINPADGYSKSVDALAYGLLEKDSCTNNLYPVIIRVKTDQIPNEALSKGVRIKASLSFTDFDLPKPIILKRSDGGLFPNAPIALLPYISGIKDSVQLIKWSRGKVVSRTNLSRGNLMVSLGYWRKLIGPLLRGGKGVFQVNSPFPKANEIAYYNMQAYSRCFQLVDKRQVSN
ncbi:MAG: hypothetical protein GYA55_01965, partial [SAR324 cluster bacterium]|nr:hypothetical protein [SAR324 cluster bacterium]